MNYAIVAAHPDDEVLGCGGSVARWVAQGHRVEVLILCENSARHGRPKDYVEHAEAARSVLGYQALTMENYPDQSLDRLDFSQELVSKIEQFFKSANPDVVLMHSMNDLNRDHRVAAEASKVAAYSIKKAHQLLAYHPYGSYAMGMNASDPRVRVYVRLERIHVEKKLKAFSMYELEQKSQPHPRSLEVLRADALALGGFCDAPYAEAFEPLKLCW